MDKKILLIKPENLLGLKLYPPLGLLSIGTILKNKGYQVDIIQLDREGGAKSFRNKLLKERNSILTVGISALTPELNSAIETARFLKDSIDVPLIFGGWHATLFPQQTCEDDLVDMVVVGEGEDTFLQLVKNIASGKGGNGVDGVVHKENGSVVSNPPAKLVDVEQLPSPDFELCDVNTYLSTLPRNARRLHYQSSRGCPYRCRFCSIPTTDVRHYRKKSPEKVVSDVEELVKRYSLAEIEFIDDCFFVDKERARKIAEGILKRNLKIKWFAECRADYFRDNFLDDKTLELLVRSGLDRLTLGFESGSPEMLKMIDKRIVVEDITNAIRRCKRFKITPKCSFIIGFPNESKEDTFMTIELIDWIKKEYTEAMVGVGIYRPFPKTSITDDLIKKGLYREPSRFKDWADLKVLYNYISLPKEQPWQNNPKLIRNLSAYLEMATIRYAGRTSRVRYILYISKAIAEFRLKFKLFIFPIDSYIYYLGQRIYLRYLRGKFGL